MIPHIRISKQILQSLFPEPNSWEYGSSLSEIFSSSVNNDPTALFMVNASYHFTLASKKAKRIEESLSEIAHNCSELCRKVK